MFILARGAGRIRDALSKKAGPWKAVAAGAIVLYAAAFSIQTYKRNAVWQDGLRLFTDVIEKNPGAGHGHFIRGVFKHNRLGDTTGALNDYNRAASLCYESPHLYANRAGVRGILGDYEGALSDSNRAVDLNPDNPQAYFNRATAKYFLKDFKGAAGDFEAALRKNPAYADAAYMLGAAFLELEDRDRACEAWRKALALGHAKAGEMIRVHCSSLR